MNSKSSSQDMVFEYNPRNSLGEAYTHIMETANYETFEGFKQVYEEVLEEILGSLDQNYGEPEESNRVLSWSDGNESLTIVSEDDGLSDSFNSLHYTKDFEDREAIFSEVKSLDLREGRKPREPIE